MCAAVMLVLSGCSGDAPPVATGPVSAVVGPSGGSLSAADGASVSVAPGAVARDTTFTIAATTTTIPTSTARSVGTVYRFGPSGVTFARPVTVTLPFNTAALAAAAELTAWTAPDETRDFTSLGRAQVVAAGRATAQTTHFSLLGLGVLPTPDAGASAPDAGAPTGCGPVMTGGLPDGRTFVPRDGGPGGDVTISWTINGQPGSATTCLGNTATRLWAVNLLLNAVEGQPGGVRTSQSENPRINQTCAAGMQTFPAVVGGCYQLRAYLVELRADNLPTGTVLASAPVQIFPVGAAPVRVSVAFVTP